VSTPSHLLVGNWNFCLVQRGVSDRYHATAGEHPGTCVVSNVSAAITHVGTLTAHQAPPGDARGTGTERKSGQHPERLPLQFVGISLLKVARRSNASTSERRHRGLARRLVAVRRRARYAAGGGSSSRG
jgi:hypothetical protein